MRNLLLGILAVVGLVVLSGAAYAQNPSGGPWEKFRLSVGGFATTSDSELQLNSTNLGVGVVVDLENTLGVKASNTTYRIDTLYRFGETQRHQVEFHYFESNRSATRTLNESVTIGDVTFPVNAAVNTQFDLNFANIDYAYAFLQDDRVRLAASAGLHVTGIKLKVESQGVGVEEESFTAPLPVIGMRLDVALAEKWILKAAADVFYLEYDNFAGGLADTYLGVEWNPLKHFGFGLGVNSIRYRIKGEGSEINGMDFNGKVNFGLTGLLLYGKYFF